MKYPVTMLAVAAVMLLVGLGIHMHAEWKYTDKMYYHTVASGLYAFEDVFAERKLGDTVQVVSIIVGVAAGVWLIGMKLSSDRRNRS